MSDWIHAVGWPGRSAKRGLLLPRPHRHLRAIRWNHRRPQDLPLDVRNGSLTVDSQPGAEADQH
jgi:hypothetical protein